MKSSNVKKIIQISLLIAIFVLLGKILTLDFHSFKITVKTLPLYVGAIVFGDLSGALIGCIGELLLQLTGNYGFTATTFFWALPYAIVGSICGIAFKRNFIKLNSDIKYWIFIICMQLLVTLLNTIVIIIDSLIFGYYNPITIISNLITRFMLAILTGIVYCIVIKYIVDAIKKIH